MEYMEFACDSKHVEVFINGSYRGIYLLTEQVQVNEGRVNVDTKGEKDETLVDTGYLLELEASTTRRADEGVEGEAWFKLDDYAKAEPIDDSYKVDNNTVAYYVVKSDARSEQQMAYIKNYMTDVYDAIYKTKNREQIESLIDINTAIDMYIMQSLCNDIDGNYSSIYVYKDKGGKLKFGPPWDFDNCYMNNTNSSTFYHILSDLYKNYDWFNSLVKVQMKEYLKECGIVDQVFAATRQEVETYKDDFNNREYAKWRSTNSTGFGNNFSTVNDALDSFENWLTAHREWMKTEYKL